MTYTIDKKQVKLIQSILGQIGGPTKIDNTAMIRFYMTEELIEEVYNFIRTKSGNEDVGLSYIQLHTLLCVMDYMIYDMGVEEFSTVLGIDYIEGLNLLAALKKLYWSRK